VDDATPPAYFREASGTVREVRGCRRDRTTFAMRMSVSHVVVDGAHLFTAILSDITQEKEDKARLEAAHQVIQLERCKLEALLDSTVRSYIRTNTRTQTSLENIELITNQMRGLVPASLFSAIDILILSAARINGVNAKI
jgi:hypothetical protein